MKQVRTRYAPSPTGYLHVGGARTALFSWLLARHFGGKFILRIEDTDRERLVPGAIGAMLQELAWFGIVPDEGPSHEHLRQVGESIEGTPDLGGDFGPYIQSLRTKRYGEVAEELISKGFCYRCDCTPEMLERERLEQMARKESPGYTGYCRDRNVSAESKHVVRFRMPFKKTVVLEDAVKGRVVWDNIPLRDTVLLKSDGMPTYHLAVVVDDHDMLISHVLRGDEWLSTAPLHVLLYEALGWEKPVFAHLPVIKGSNGKKLSKRDGSVNTSNFREEGYLPTALINFTVLIGWSEGDGTEQEIYTLDELVSKFTLERVNPASGIFDYGKLAWMNGTYIRNLPYETFHSLANTFIDKKGFSVPDERLRAIGPLVQERVKLLTEIPPMVEFLSEKKVERDLSEMLAKDMDIEKAKVVLDLATERLSALADFSHAAIEECLRALVAEVGAKAGSVFGVLRIAVMGKKVTPPLFESFTALGREETLRRMVEARQLI
jgi:glutamyl-tRNA synthetase